MVDIHNYKKRAEQSLDKLKRAEISDYNKKKIGEFYRHCIASGIGYGKVHRYTDDLVKLSLLLRKDFNKCKKEDIESLIIELEKKDYSEWTKSGYKVLIKKFFKWLRGTDESPPEVKWIRVGVKKKNQKLPEDVLTQEEIKKLVDYAGSKRNKAFVSSLYESGGRIGEILTPNIKNIAFDQFGARITVFGKTGSRVIRLVSSVPYLQEWLNEHPDRDNPDAFIWIKEGSKNELVGYDRMRILLGRIAKKAGIKKRVNPHSFRHARATHLANHLTESQLEQVLGWIQGSKMSSIYVHLSGRDTEEAILRLYGKQFNKNPYEEQQVFQTKECVRCKTNNESTNKFCKLCGFVLDKETQQQIMQKDLERENTNEIMNVLFKDQELMAMFMKKIKESGVVVN